MQFKKKDINQSVGIIWDDVNWKKAYRTVRNLRRRIFRASKEGNNRNVRKLQRLMLQSQSNILISIRRVTQINNGKKTAGIDKYLALTKEERSKLAETLINHRHLWKPLPTKRILIPKKNGKQRPLSIPTIIDRCLQNIHKNALEPEWEARFESTSYGFRPGRSCQDAMQRIFKVLNGSKATRLWIVEGDIKGCFDNIDHKPLLEKIGSYPGKNILKKWLKAGFVQNNKKYETEYGTPQGGIISPLLANIALDGIEESLGIKYRWHKASKCWTADRAIGVYARYADDFIVMVDSKNKAYQVKTKLKEELAKIGLELSEEKTRIIHANKGFDFLSWNFRRYETTKRKTGFILLIKPSKKSRQSFKDTLKEVFKELRGHNQAEVINRLNPIIRGWANYHKSAVSKETFSELDNFIYNKLVKWAKRTHPRKPKEWIKKRYWGQYCQGRKDKWVFGYAAKDDNGKESVYYLEKLAWTVIQRHTLVQYKNSPDDSTQSEYWEKRNLINEERRTLQALSKGKNKIAQATNYKCQWCGQALLSEGINNIQRHHIVPKGLGGKDSYNNLIYLHSECHRQVTKYEELNPNTLKKIGAHVNYDEKKQIWRVQKIVV